MEGGKGGGKKLNWKITHALKTQGNTLQIHRRVEKTYFSPNLSLRARASYRAHARRIQEEREGELLRVSDPRNTTRPVPRVFFCSHTLDGILEKLPLRSTQRPDKAPRKASL